MSFTVCIFFCASLSSQISMAAPSFTFISNTQNPCPQSVASPSMSSLASSRVVMVTGGAGFIGCHTAAALLARGDDVVVVDNLSMHGYPSSVKSANLQWLRELAAKSPGTLEIAESDITDRAAMKSLFANRIDVVCHLAARAGVRQSISSPESYINTNIAGTAILLELAASYACSNFVYASSSSVYGARPSTADSSSKTQMAVMREGDATGQPMSPYAASKAASEAMAGVYHHLYKIPITGLRFFTVYGPRGRPEMAPLKFMSLMYRGLPIERFGDGSSWRDYTYVDDVVDGVLAAIDKPHACEVFNMGAGRPVTLSDFICTLEKIMKCSATIIQKPEQKGDIGGTYADIHRASSMLGYSPKVKLEDGLERLYIWFKANHSLIAGLLS